MKAGRHTNKWGWIPRLLGVLALCCAPYGTVPVVGAGPSPQVLELVTAMESSWDNILEYTKDIEKTERLIDGSLKYERGMLKFRKPHYHYLRVDEGENAGGEIIYPMPGNRDLAIAHPGGAAGTLFRLATRTPLLRDLVPTLFSIQDPRIIEGQHHAVTGSNLGSVIRLIASNLRAAAHYDEGSVTISDESLRGQPVQRLDITLPSNAGSRHNVQHGETLWTIALKYSQNMYVILYNNPKTGNSIVPEPGQVLFIPRYYAPKGIIWVSTQTSLPVKLKIFDRAGQLYESYLYTNIDTKPGLNDQDFDPANPAYRF